MSSESPSQLFFAIDLKGLEGFFSFFFLKLISLPMVYCFNQVNFQFLEQLRGWAEKGKVFFSI